MKFSNILFLCLVVLLALISCSDAGKRKGGKGVGRKGKPGKGRLNPTRRLNKGRKGGKGKKSRGNKDDEDEDEDKKRNRKNRKGGKSGTRKFGKKKGRKGGKGKGKKSDSEGSLFKKGKGKGKGKGKSGKSCRHPDGASRIEGHILAQKISGANPCYKIHCRSSGRKNVWMYEEQTCVTCTSGGVKYFVGYVSEQKCYGPPPCHITMCMADGNFRKQGWPCDDHTYFDTTPSSGTKYVYFKCTWASKTWKSTYSDTSSSDFKSLDSSIQAKIKSAGISNYKSSKVTKAYSGSTGTKGYVKCSGSCSNSAVKAGLEKAGASSVSTSSSSLTTTSTKGTTTTA